jgi:hypothetical protein
MTVIIENSEAIVKEKLINFLKDTDYLLSGRFESTYVSLYKKHRVFFNVFPSTVQLTDTIFFKNDGFKVEVFSKYLNEVKELFDRFNKEEKTLNIVLVVKS